MKGFEIACAVPWAIREDALRTILDIAARVRDDDETIKAFAAIEAVSARPGKPIENTRNAYERQGVAIVPVAGPIFRHAGLFTRISGASSVEDLSKDIATVANNPDFKGIILEIDSPGGEIAGIEELAAQIGKLAVTKPIVAYVDGLGASAAYWLASAASEVRIAPTAMVGSIGVVAAHRDTKEMDAKLGVKTIEIVSSQSPKKRPDPATDAGRAQIQANVDQLADIFIRRVATYRDTTPAKVKADFGAGDLMVGRRAVKAGMADRVSSFEATLSDFAASRIRVREAIPPTTADEPPADHEPPEEPPMANDWRDTLIARMLGLGPAATEGTGDDQGPDDLIRRASGTLRLPRPAPRCDADTTVLLESKPDPEKEELKRKVAALTARQAQVDAAAFADDLIRSGRATPAERADLVMAFAQAARDDADLPAKVAFPDPAGKPAEGSRVEALKALYARRPAARFTEELLPSHVTLSNDQQDSERERFDKESAGWIARNVPANGAAR